MKTIRMVCDNCGGEAFSFRWSYNSDAELDALMMCHDGYGLQLEDAAQTCVGCGREDSSKTKSDDDAV